MWLKLAQSVCVFLSKTTGVEMSKKSFYSPKLPERNMRVRASKLMHWSAKSGWFWMSLIVPGGNPKKAFVSRNSIESIWTYLNLEGVTSLSVKTWQKKRAVFRGWAPIPCRQEAHIEDHPGFGLQFAMDFITMATGINPTEWAMMGHDGPWQTPK